MAMLIRLYRLITGNKANTIDNSLSRIQENVSAYNSTIDMVIHNNSKLLDGE